MVILAFLGIVFTLPFLIDEEYRAEDIVIRELRLFTITVPPALPAAMNVGTIFTLSRLKRQKIFCISPPRINVSGRVSLMVFDKTGTLTEEGLHVYGFRPLKKK